MKKQDRYRFILEYFEKTSPRTETELKYNNPYELLVAVMLSAQCTDKRINQVTPALFAAYPTVHDMAKATPDDLLEYIGSVSYPNSKARHLGEMARVVSEKFNGTIPDNFDSLVSLPGVGRKTANVMLAVAFGQAALAVDTHVFRVSHRLGLVPDSCNTPEKTEKELVKNIPQDIISDSHHWLLLHGRYICKARRPECEKCVFTSICKYFAAEKKPIDSKQSGKTS